MAVLSPQENSGPDKGEQHQESPQGIHHSGDGVVVFQPPQLAENVVPIMVTGAIASRRAAQENQFSGARVVNVRRRVHEALAQPPKANAGPKSVPGFNDEGDHDDRWNQPLIESPSQDSHEPAEGYEDHVARFMKDEVNVMHERIADLGIAAYELVVFGSHELPSPDDQTHLEENTAVEVQWGYFRGHIEKLRRDARPESLPGELLHGVTPVQKRCHAVGGVEPLPRATENPGMPSFGRCQDSIGRWNR